MRAAGPFEPQISAAICRFRSSSLRPDLRDDKNLVRPRIFDFAAGRPASDIDISALGVKGAENKTGFALNGLGDGVFDCRERGLGRGCRAASVCSSGSCFPWGRFSSCGRRARWRGAGNRMAWSRQVQFSRRGGSGHSCHDSGCGCCRRTRVAKRSPDGAHGRGRYMVRRGRYLSRSLAARKKSQREDQQRTQNWKSGGRSHWAAYNNGICSAQLRRRSLNRKISEYA